MRKKTTGAAPRRHGCRLIGPVLHLCPGRTAAAAIRLGRRLRARGDLVRLAHTGCQVVVLWIS